MTKKILAGALALAMAAGAWAQAKPASITIGFQVIPNDELLAKAQGLYEKELGVKVEFKQFDSGCDVEHGVRLGLPRLWSRRQHLRPRWASRAVWPTRCFGSTTSSARPKRWL